MENKYVRNLTPMQYTALHNVVLLELDRDLYLPRQLSPNLQLARICLFYLHMLCFVQLLHYVVL